MNWTALVYGGPMLAVSIWWVVDARKWFKGPKVNIEHQILGREGNVVEGKYPAHVHDGSDSGSGSLKGTQKVLADQKAANLA